MLNDVKITRIYAGAVAGFGDTLSSDILDMTGFEGVMLIASLGDCAATGVITLTAQQDTAAAGGTMATLSGDAVTYTCAAADADNDLLVLDLYKPEERYVRAQLTRATANIVVNDIVAIQYGAMKAPVTQPATVLDSALLVSPAQV